uniref:Uncharacterized protein n=1 Tax=Trichobilharzia regenti TaxID=157069 RepID=A0AA85JZN0_TRIRE|nr:unnamed protein product [Trichobilharzia regenti]
MLHFNLENPFTFMEQELLTLEHENKRYSPKPTEIGHIRVTMQYKISNPDKEDNSDDWISFGWTQIQCFTEKENSKSATETDTKIYPYNLWAREVINPVEQGLCPEPLPDPTWTLTYLLIPFNHLFYYFFPTSLPQTDKHESPQLLQGSRISLRIYNPKIETVPKAVDKPLIYITRRIQVKEAVHETLADMIDGEYLEDEENEEQDVRVIEEVSPPATPLDDPWVAFKKPAPYERQMKPSSTSETFCIYIDQLRFMPDDSTIFKVTGRLLNTNYDEELIDILSVPEELPNNHENSRSPVFSSNQRLIVNLGKNKNLARNSLLFLRVYTLTLRDLNYVVVGNSLLKIFNSDGLLNIGGHQLRLRCEVPAPVSKNGNEYIYGEKALDNIPYIHCATILVRLLPYTEEPIPAPDYKLRSYHSQESTPTEFEWIVYRQFQTHEKRKIDIRSIVKMILRREKEFEASKDQADFLNPDYLHRYTLKRLSVRRNLTGINIPNQMASIFPFFYRINEGFLLSLKSARGLVANRGDFIFALAKVIRGSETNSLPVNKFYGYGNDDDLLFVKVNTKSYLGNPVWEDEPNLTKPYYDSNALLVIQIFRVPLIFTIGGSINISKTDNWFTAQLASDMKSKRRSSKLRKTHLIGWSFVRLFEWGFLRNGTHELCVLKPPIRSRTLSKIQNDDGKAAALWRTDSLLQNTVLTIHLQNARFLDYVEERKPEPQPNYSQLQTDQLEKINEFNESDEKVKQLNEINLDSMVKHRAKNDVNWLEDNQDAAEKLLTEIHELLKTQVEDCPSKQEYMPLFVTRL